LQHAGVSNALSRARALCSMVSTGAQQGSQQQLPSLAATAGAWA
jgi:hypothetical protein